MHIYRFHHLRLGRVDHASRFTLADSIAYALAAGFSLSILGGLFWFATLL